MEKAQSQTPFSPSSDIISQRQGEMNFEDRTLNLQNEYEQAAVEDSNTVFDFGGGLPWLNGQQGLFYTQATLNPGGQPSMQSHTTGMDTDMAYSHFNWDDSDRYILRTQQVPVPIVPDYGAQGYDNEETKFLVPSSISTVDWMNTSQSKETSDIGSPSASTPASTRRSSQSDSQALPFAAGSPSASEPQTSRRASKASNAPSENSGQIACTNCSTNNTPLWRRDFKGHPLCNACGLFMKLHGIPRPMSMKTDVFKTRKRGPSMDSPSGGSKAARTRSSRNSVITSKSPNSEKAGVGSIQDVPTDTTSMTFF
jgi:GATA-binding protein